MPTGTSWLTYAWLAAGGAAGTLARYAFGGLVQRLGSSFPVGTLAVNVTGSFLLGFLMRYLLASGMSADVRLALTVGLCGGYTTFSTFSYETAMLLEDGQLLRAGLYIAASVVLSMVAMLAGLAAARALVALPR